MPDEKQNQKGVFGKADLPVAGAYLEPESRNRLLAIGGAGAGLLALILAAGFWFSAGGWASSGRLSSSHSGLEGNCQVCHDAFQSVADAKCVDCHDRQHPRPGIYTFQAHSNSHSSDLDPASGQDGEIPCVSCHPEHRGRDASLTSNASQRCLACHPFGPFDSSHPEFDRPTLENQGEGEEVAFSHTGHMETLGATLDNTAGTCVVCHVPLPDGKRFAPLDFEARCGDCHEANRTVLMRFEKDLRVLRRGEFDHSAHMLQRSCTECHTPLEFARPGIEVCRECHNSRQASDRCTLCHRFHPPGTTQAGIPPNAGLQNE